MPEDKFKSSSFIPKGGAQYDGPSSVSSRRNGLLLTTSLVLAGLAVAATTGAFFYKQYLESDLSDKQQELSQAQAAFDSEVIEELNNIDTRLSSADKILQNHTAISPVFDVVESVTVSSVQLTALSVIHPRSVSAALAEANNSRVANEQGQSASGPGTVSVTMDGIARDHAAVALQSQAMSENEAVQDAVMSNFTLNEQGNVEFTIQFALATEYMSYESTL